MTEKIARYYDESRNPDGAFLPGVGLRDLTEAEFDALPEWLQQSVDALACYRKTKPAESAPLRGAAVRARDGDAADGRKE